MSQPRARGADVTFTPSAGRTLGVEWEVGLLDPRHPRPGLARRRAARARQRHRRRQPRPADQVEVDGHPGAAAQHGRDRHGRVRERRAGGLRPRRRAGPGARRGHRARRAALRRRVAPVRALGGPGGQRRPPVRDPDRPHPVVGPADGDLRRARARRHPVRGEGVAAHQRAAHLPPAPHRAVGVVAVHRGHRHRLREQPHHALPAAADGRAAVPVRDVVAVPHLPRRRVRHRGHHRRERAALGHPALAAARHHRGACLRRLLPAGGRRGRGGAHPLPRARPRAPARRRGAPTAAPAVARAGEQVARSAIRPRRHHHPRRRQHRGARRRRHPTSCSSGSSRPPARLGCTRELAGITDILDAGAGYQRMRAAAEADGAIDLQAAVREMVVHPTR